MIVIFLKFVIILGAAIAIICHRRQQAYFRHWLSIIGPTINSSFCLA